MEKTCRRCNTTKPSDQFGRHRSRGMQTYCRACVAEIDYIRRTPAREANAALRAAALAAVDKTCTRCRESKPKSEFYADKRKPDGLRSWCKPCHISDTMEDARNRSKTESHKANIRRGNLARVGMTPERYDEMLAAQNGVCAICRQPERRLHTSGTTRRLAVDHCHKTHRIRGLLCASCNTAIGHFREDPAIMDSAAEYLQAHLAGV